MKIAINALCSENRSGTGRYTTQLILALAQIDHENTYSICAPSDSSLLRFLGPYRNFQVYPWNGKDMLNRLLFERYVIPRWVQAEGADIFHGPAFIIPPKCPVPALVTIHDLVFHIYPHTIPIARRPYYRMAIPRSIRESSLILADSESTARDLRQHMGVSEAKISTAPLGVSPRFFTTPSPADLKQAKIRYNLPEKYIITVGTLEPRKNLQGLIRAYSNLLKIIPSAPDLVIAGRIGWKSRALKPGLRVSDGSGKRIRFIGFVEDADLPALYRQASIFACVSLYEGFGLPVLEAMAVGTPVIASNVSSLPEVTGSSAYLVQPDNPEDIAKTLAHMLENPTEAHEKAVQAQIRARNFSWKSTAEKTLAAYQAVFRK